MDQIPEYPGHGNQTPKLAGLGEMSRADKIEQVTGAR